MSAAPVPAPVDALIAALPKAELHLHLEGAMPPALMLELAERHGVAGIPPTVEAVADWYRFRDFDHFLAVYHAAVTVLHDEDDFARLVEATAATLAAQNVRYAEIIVTPQPHLARGVPAEAILGGLERGRVTARGRHGIELRWVPDFVGAWGAETGEETLDVVLAAGLDSVVGFNVGGPEVEREQFAAVFARARAAGLHSVPHAGESAEPGGAARMWSAVRDLGAERIGHGVRCLDDPALVEHLVATGIPLDVCPTSNLRTRVVGTLAEHPLPRLLGAGLTVTLNSDDPAMFETTLTDEYRAAYRMGLPAPALVDLARAGVRASYADEALKSSMLAGIDTAVAEHRLAG